MRKLNAAILCLTSLALLSACQKASDAEVSKAIKSVNVIDESNLNDIMLTSADPNEAVAYFQRALSENPDRLDLQRGLGKSLIRAKRSTEASVIWAKIVARSDATDEDRLEFANALIRNNEWDKAETVLDSIPPTLESFERYRLEALIADSNKEWKKADSFYETATGLTTQPGSVLNNWGYSKLVRGNYSEAERLFGEAVTYAPDLFTAKNNLVLARAYQRKYTLPILQIDQTQRAQLLHTLALSAVKQGDVEVGKSLLQDAIDTHPQYFEAAVRSLSTLEG